MNGRECPSGIEWGLGNKQTEEWHRMLNTFIDTIS